MKGTCLWLSLLGFIFLFGCSEVAAEQKASTGGRTMTEAASPTPTTDQQPRQYSKDLGELRAQFNRDKGKVRLVTLLSPT